MTPFLRLKSFPSFPNQSCDQSASSGLAKAALLSPSFLSFPFTPPYLRNQNPPFGGDRLPAALKANQRRLSRGCGFLQLRSCLRIYLAMLIKGRRRTCGVDFTKCDGFRSRGSWENLKDPRKLIPAAQCGTERHLLRR